MLVNLYKQSAIIPFSVKKREEAFNCHISTSPRLQWVLMLFQMLADLLLLTVLVRLCSCIFIYTTASHTW